MGEIGKLARRLLEEYLKTSPAHSKAVLPACYYLACVAKGKRITQREIAHSSGYSTVTIRKVYKDILKKVRTVGDRDYEELGEEKLTEPKPECFVCGKKVKYFTPVYTIGTQVWVPKNGAPLLEMPDEIILDSICPKCWKRVEKESPFLRKAIEEFQRSIKR